MLTESTELIEARKNVDKAVREFVRVLAAEQGWGNDVFVAGWATYAEYLTTDLMEEGASGNAIIVPEDQHASTSRGLFSYGVDAFSRRGF